MKKKTKRASDYRGAPVRTGARSQGGDTGRDTVTSTAAQKQKPGDSDTDNGSKCAGPAAGEDGLANGNLYVGRKNKRSENGDQRNQAEKNIAARSKSNGRSIAPLPSTRRLTGQGGGNGEVDAVAGRAGATRRRKSRQTRTRVPPAPGMSGNGDDESRVEPDSNHVVATPQEQACRDLQVHQRFRADAIASRIRIDNALTANVARYYGYSAKLDEKERATKWAAANVLIKAVRNGKLLQGSDAKIAERAGGLIVSSCIASDGYQKYIDDHSKAMERLVESLPIAKWVKGVRGLGMVSAGSIIGEAGDLSLYANPGKLWKRLGLAPFNGKMPSTWRRKGGLSAEEWTAVGYSPRRRSLMYVIGECLVKQNGEVRRDGELIYPCGPYRARYDEAKAAKLTLESEDWPKLRCHLHGMLLAVKRLVRDLWKEWRAVK